MWWEHSEGLCLCHDPVQPNVVLVCHCVGRTSKNFSSHPTPNCIWGSADGIAQGSVWWEHSEGLCLCHDPAAGLSLSPAAPGESFSLSLSIPRFSLQRPQLGALSAWTRCDCNPLCHVPIAKQPPVSQEFSSLQGGRPSCFLSSTRFLPSGCLARRPHMVAPNPFGLFTQAGPLHP